MVSPGSWPSTLAVGGALSLKAVAGLRILVNAASTIVRRIIARAIGCVKSAIRRIMAVAKSVLHPHHRPELKFGLTAQVG